jgi:hypothetical protein
MSIPFKSIQHFFLFEQRPSNKLNGKVTQHPFACVAIGHEPSEPKLPFRVSIAISKSGTPFLRKYWANRAVGLLQSTFEGKDAKVAWFKPSECKNFGKVLIAIGATNGLKHHLVNFTRASKSFKNVITDISGKRIHKVTVKPAVAAKKLESIQRGLKSGMKLVNALASA